MRKRMQLHHRIRLAGSSDPVDLAGSPFHRGSPRPEPTLMAMPENAKYSRTKPNYDRRKLCDFNCLSSLGAVVLVKKRSQMATASDSQPGGLSWRVSYDAVKQDAALRERFKS